MSPHDTIEERLQRALDDVAETTRLSPDAWAEVQRRARRRRVPRVMLAAAAVLVVGAIATATVLLVGRDDGVEIATDDQRAPECGAQPPTDLSVMLEPGSSASEIEAVEQLLADSRTVANSAFLSQEEAVRVFRCIFAGEPETIADTDLGRIPEQFQVTLTDQRAELPSLLQNLEALDGVFTIRRDCSDASVAADLEIFMLLDATPEQIAGARAAIEQAPGVANVTFVSKEDTHEVFTCLFADQPDLVEATDPEVLPPSFLVSLGRGVDGSALAERFRLLDGVDAVTDQRSNVVGPMPDELWSARP
jgi:cell division protein FtsX